MGIEMATAPGRIASVVRGQSALSHRRRTRPRSRVISGVLIPGIGSLRRSRRLGIAHLACGLLLLLLLIAPLLRLFAAFLFLSEIWWSGQFTLRSGVRWGLGRQSSPWIPWTRNFHTGMSERTGTTGDALGDAWGRC
jgi:hypothetical protein